MDGQPAPRRLVSPSIVFRDRTWPADEIGAIARDWHDHVRAELPRPTGLAAVAMVNHPHAVALFLALSALPTPLIVLPPEPRGWRSAPPIPAGTPLVLLPALWHLAAEAERLGLRPVVLPEPDVGRARGAEVVPILSGPGLVLFTSGSTGPPKPVFRTMSKLLAAVAARLELLGVPRHAGIIGSLPLHRGQGLNAIVFPATLLESPVALLERPDHRALLAVFASAEHHFWSASAATVDVLTRCSLPGPCRAPTVCLSSNMPERIWRAFRERFGVPLRGCYGITESGHVTVDASAPGEVRSETVGRPMPGVEVRVGDDPERPLPPGRTGRIWIRSPWYMEGYGFPPSLEPRREQDGWRGTSDLGQVDGAGYLTLLGRVDDCVATGAGYLVNLAEVARVLTDCAGVTDAAVLPLEGRTGPVIAALIESDIPVDPQAVRQHVSHLLPPWSHPRVIRFTRELPRLPGGKIDRQACLHLLR